MNHKIISASILSLFLVIATSNSVSAFELSKNIKQGQKGDDVVYLQNFLITKGYLEGQATGYFGNLTKAAVIRYQKEKNLLSVGHVGPLTRKAIQEDLGTAKNTIVESPKTNSTESVKESSIIEDKKWKLVELQGKKITASHETHYIIFNKKDQHLSAKAGCNQMNGSYTLDGYKLKVGGMLSTMMACENMEDEQTLAQVLDMTDNISYTETTLSLNKARMAPLAQFELVK